MQFDEALDVQLKMWKWHIFFRKLSIVVGGFNIEIFILI